MIRKISRRSILKMGIATMAAPIAGAHADNNNKTILAPKNSSQIDLKKARVSIVRCKEYGKAVKLAYQKCFYGLGGISGLVKNKTVTIKVNFTWTPTSSLFLNHPYGETFMTHGDTAAALISILFENGAKRVRIVESASSTKSLEVFASSIAGWDIREILSLGNVEFENTRNLGKGNQYVSLKVRSGGFLFSEFLVNHSYEDTDVFISLAKMKNHTTAGVTLSMKNLIGIAPNSLYSARQGEDVTVGRLKFHDFMGKIVQGEKKIHQEKNDHFRIPYIINDLCDARPIDLAIIDGITTVSGGEGPWSSYEGGKLAFEVPQVIIAGLNPVSTDAVALSVMGYEDPLHMNDHSAPFQRCVNHIMTAHQNGIGTADMNQIEISGLSIEEALYPFPNAT